MSATKHLMRAFAASCCLAMAAAPAAAQGDKPMTIVVGFGAGGSYHAIAVLLSQHMGRHLPGSPSIVVKPMPGAGGLVAANHLANVAPKDGSVLGTTGAGTILEPLFGNEKAKYDARKFNWIGSMSTEVFYCAVMATSPVRTFADLKTRETTVGSTGRGSRTFSYPTALNNLLGSKLKVITGYRGLNDINLAMERGELEGVCGWGWGGIKARNMNWLRENKLVFLTQFTHKKVADAPDAPLVLDMLSSERDRQAIKLLIIDTLVAWPLLAPPDLSTAQVATLRKAYMATLKDPAFVAAATKQQREIDPVTGEEIHKAIDDLYETPKDVVEYARRISGMK